MYLKCNTHCSFLARTLLSCVSVALCLVYAVSATAAERPQIQIGASGPDVLFLKRSLNLVVEPSPLLIENDDFDAATKLAVEKLQTLNRLRVDGIVGPETWPVVESRVLNAFSSRGSTNYLTPNGTSPIIYLTFDDGPEPGTSEVLSLLRSENVPATFFFVGEYALLYENEHPGFLLDLYRDGRYQIGNHSDTQSHQFYKSYYEAGGLRINRDTLEPDARAASPSLRRSVLMDFEYGAVSFTSALAGIKATRPDVDYKHDFTSLFDRRRLTGYSRFEAARMPGQNRWRLPGITVDPFSPPAFDAEQEADQLIANSSTVFGWDEEWKPTPDEFGDLQRAEFEQGEDGIIDMFTPQTIEFDRPGESAAEVFEKVKNASAKTSGRVILLMHDRQFRRYKTGEEDKYTDMLRKFIRLCIDGGMRFDVLANYSGGTLLKSGIEVVDVDKAGNMFVRQLTADEISYIDQNEALKNKIVDGDITNNGSKSVLVYGPNSNGRSLHDNRLYLLRP